jgi:hypothetical protein
LKETQRFVFLIYQQPIITRIGAGAEFPDSLTMQLVCSEKHYQQLNGLLRNRTLLQFDSNNESDFHYKEDSFLLTSIILNTGGGLNCTLKRIYSVFDSPVVKPLSDELRRIYPSENKESQVFVEVSKETKELPIRKIRLLKENKND